MYPNNQFLILYCLKAYNQFFIAHMSTDLTKNPVKLILFVRKIKPSNALM